jgi:hypothetical protein
MATQPTFEKFRLAELQAPPSRPYFEEGFPFEETCYKKNLKKILYMKKSKCSKRAHLWLGPLSPLAHLIMIAPNVFFFGDNIMVDLLNVGT